MKKHQGNACKHWRHIKTAKELLDLTFICEKFNIIKTCIMKIEVFTVYTYFLFFHFGYDIIKLVIGEHDIKKSECWMSFRLKWSLSLQLALFCQFLAIDQITHGNYFLIKDNKSYNNISTISPKKGFKTIHFSKSSRMICRSFK